MATTKELLQRARELGLEVKGQEPEVPQETDALVSRAKELGLEVIPPGATPGAGVQPQSGLSQRTGRPEPQRSPAEEVVSQAGTGLNIGLANTLGLPVDLAAAGLRAAGVDVGSTPALGSKHLKNLLFKFGAIQPAQSKLGRRTQRVAQEIGASAVPGGVAAVRAGTRAGRVAAGEATTALAAGAGAATAQELAPGSTAAEIAGQVGPSIVGAAGEAAVRGLARGGRAGREATAERVSSFQRATEPEVRVNPRTGREEVIPVPQSVGQATQNPAIQWLESISSRAPGGVKRFRRVTDQTQEAFERRVNTIVRQTAGESVTPELAGKVVQEGIEGFAARGRATSRRLWSRVDEFMPPNTRVSPNNTIQTLDEVTEVVPGAERTSAALNNPKIVEIMENFKSDIGEDGTFPFEALRSLRTKVGSFLSKPDVFSDVPRAELKRVYSALTEDIRSSLSQSPNSQQALEAFNKANRFTRGLHQRADTILDKLNRKVAPEDIFFSISSGVGVKRGGTRARQIMRSLNKREKKLVAGAVVDQLGTAKGGSVGDFSTETFLTNYRNMSEGAKSAYFADPAVGNIKKNLDDIASNLEDLRKQARDFGNPSGTGPNIAGQFTLGGLSFAALTGNLPAVAGGVGAVGLNRLASQLLTSPGFSEWLSKSTKISAEKAPAHIARLAPTLKGESVETQEAASTFVELIDDYTNSQSPFQEDQISR